MENTNKFEFNGATYEMKPNGYCYMACEQSESGKIHRISRAKFDAEYEKYKMQFLTLPEIFTEEQVEGAVSLVSESMESEAVCEAAREAQGQEKPKKTPRKRIPKSIGYRKTIEGTEVILTEKQLDFLNHLPDTCFWEEGTNSEVWIDCLCDEIGGQFAGKPMTVGAMISTLCEKGLGYRCKNRVNNRKCTSFGLTELGRLVAEDLGL